MCGICKGLSVGGGFWIMVLREELDFSRYFILLLILCGDVCVVGGCGIVVIVCWFFNVVIGIFGILFFYDGSIFYREIV